VAAAAILSQDPPRYAPLLPLAVAGPWLAAVDLDVLRIPNRVLVPVAAATLLAIVSVAAAAQDWRTVLTPVVAALVNAAVFAAVHFATRGGIGFGDVKLAAVIGTAVGPLGVGAVWLSVLAGSVLALGWYSATRRRGPVPYGPWLLMGTWLAAIATVLCSR
jgi:leader peptidase (prepilin peptidase)/N-methyltransferase